MTTWTAATCPECGSEGRPGHRRPDVGRDRGIKCFKCGHGGGYVNDEFITEHFRLIKNEAWRVHCKHPALLEFEDALQTAMELTVRYGEDGKISGWHELAAGAADPETYFAKCFRRRLNLDLRKIGMRLRDKHLDEDGRRREVPAGVSDTAPEGDDDTGDELARKARQAQSDGRHIYDPFGTDAAHAWGMVRHCWDVTPESYPVLYHLAAGYRHNEAMAALGLSRREYDAQMKDERAKWLHKMRHLLAVRDVRIAA